MRRGQGLSTVITTAMVVVSLASPASAEEPVTDRFVDDDGIPGEVYIERLADLGAIQGCDPPENTRSCPQKNLTRAEAFKILVVAGQSYGALPDFPRTLADVFVDDDTLWDGAVSRLANFLAGQGIIDGCNPPENTRVCPDESLSRAQIAKMAAGGVGALGSR